MHGVLFGSRKRAVAGDLLMEEIAR